MTPTTLIISCEHGGNQVPPAYAPLFVGFEALLPTHRGWDPGALALAQMMATSLRAPLYSAITTRLLVDLNRSIGHHQLFSEPTQGLSAAEQALIIAQHYRPHRDAVEGAVARCIAAGQRVVHIASHSFTPVMNGTVRRADVACLYDSRRLLERTLALRWLAALKRHTDAPPGLVLRRNYPYNGQGDGLSSLLRKRHSADAYVSIELEVNHRFAQAGGAPWQALQRAITASLGAVLASEYTSDPIR